GLVILQVAGSVVLLTSAGLLLRALHAAGALDLGLTTRGVLAADDDPSAQRFSPPTAWSFTATLGQKARALPGVEGVAFTSHIPLHGGVLVSTVRVVCGRAAGTATVATTTVSPEYFGVLGVRFVAGHNFDNGAA